MKNIINTVLCSQDEWYHQVFCYNLLMESRQLYRLQADGVSMLSFYIRGSSWWNYKEYLKMFMSNVNNVKNVLKMHRFLMNGPDS